MNSQTAQTQPGQSINGLLSDLDTAIAARDPMRHVRSLKEITNLFVVSADRLATQHADVYDAVMQRLLDVVEPDVRARVAQTLAPLANAPQETLGRLACDTIAVAEPVLRHSPALTSSTLADIAGRMGQEHLLAIAGRTRLDPQVTDVLVVRGDEKVLRTTAGNPGASFSDQGFGTLVERSVDDPSLQQIIGNRPDLPAGHLRALIQRATQEVRSALLQRTSDGKAEAFAQAVNAVSKQLDQDAVQQRRDYGSAADAIVRVAQSGKLNEQTVATLATSGRRDEVICAMSAMTRLPLEAVETAFSAEVCHGVILMARALDFSWPSARRLLRLRPGTRPPVDEMQRLSGEFSAMDTGAARRALNFLVPRAAPSMMAA